MKNIFLLSLLLAMSCTSFAQKQTFDVVSFAFPKGWQQQKSEAGIQLSITDKKTGDYGIGVITKARVSSASANENFNNDWDKLEKTTHTFEIKYYSGSGGYSLIINTNKNTERDGTLGRDGFSYSKFETGKSIIDNPPGFKIGL